MSAPKNRFGRVSRRLAAAAAAGLAGAGAFATPAAAQTPAVEAVFVEDYSPVTAGRDATLFTAQIIFDAAFPAEGHGVTATFTVDAPEGAFGIENDGDDEDCAPNAAGTAVTCARDAGESVYFDFLYAATPEAEAGVYDYTVDFAVDGETVETFTGDIEVAAGAEGSARPYLHGGVDLGEVDPGGSAGATPVILQEEALDADAAAVLVEFDGQQTLVSNNDPVEILAAYDNCTAEGDGVACVIADFEDAPGQAYTFTGPVEYRLAEDAPGPYEYCRCEYRVSTLTEDEAESRYGDGVLELDGDLLGLTATEEDGQGFDPVAGTITLAGTANEYDLSVGAVDAKGAKGDEVTVRIPVANEGPASAYTFFDGPGSYAVVGELPKGAALVAIEDGDEWNCFTGSDMASYLNDEVTADRLAELDFACLFFSMEQGADRELAVTVEITDADAEGAGSVEVLSFEHEGYPGDFEADAANDTAAFTLDGSGSGKLPTTGTSMTVIYVAAAAVLVAGVLLLVLTRRRKAAAE